MRRVDPDPKANDPRRYLLADRSRHGQLRHYVQVRDGIPKIRIRAEHGTEAFDRLVTRAVEGVPMYDPSIGWPPERVASKLGEFLKTLHAADAKDSPFGVKKPGHVLIHGDYCLPNVLVHEGKLSGIIDVGLAGLGNPETDLAAGVWTLQYNYGKGHGRAFLDAFAPEHGPAGELAVVTRAQLPSRTEVVLEILWPALPNRVYVRAHVWRRRLGLMARFHPDEQQARDFLVFGGTNRQ